MWHIIGPNPWWICNGHQYTPYPHFRFFPILPTFWRLSQTIWEAERPTLLVLRPKNRIRRQCWRFQVSHIYFLWSVFNDCQITSNGTNVWNRGVEFHDMSKFGVGAYSYTQVNSKVCQKHSKTNMRQLFRIPIYTSVETFLFSQPFAQSFTQEGTSALLFTIIGIMLQFL